LLKEAEDNPIYENPREGWAEECDHEQAINTWYILIS